MAVKFKVILRDSFYGIRKNKLEIHINKNIKNDDHFKFVKHLESTIPNLTKNLLINSINNKDYTDLENFNITNTTNEDFFYKVGIKNLIKEIVQHNIDKPVVSDDLVKLFTPILYHYIIQELNIFYI